MFARPSPRCANQIARRNRVSHQAIDLSLDAHLAAMKMMRPGLYEYQIAAKMVEVHAMGGSEAEGYAPIVGAGPIPWRCITTSYRAKSRTATSWCSTWARNTRATPRTSRAPAGQRKIHRAPARDLRHRAGRAKRRHGRIKPGASLCKKGDQSLYKISYDYINSHGKDRHGKSLGQYYIHGLGHNIGLDVHDPGEYCQPLQPGMVVTMEPGIYIPEENLGVRIEDDVLITETGYKLLSQRLPRDPVEIEKIMADAAKTARQTSHNPCAFLIAAKNK